MRNVQVQRPAGRVDRRAVVHSPKESPYPQASFEFLNPSLVELNVIPCTPSTLQDVNGRRDIACRASSPSAHKLTKVTKAPGNTSEQ